MIYPLPNTRGRTRGGEICGGVPGYDDELAPCPSVWEAIGDLPDLDEHEGSALSDELELTAHARETLERDASRYVAALRSNPDRDDFGYRRRWDPGVVTSSCRTTHAPEVRSRFARTASGHAEKVSRFFKLSAHGVSPTLRAGTHYDRGSFNAPRPIHPVHPRVISVREAARLHSYPDWFRFHWTKWHGFREVGNSLPPRVGRAVVAEVVKAMEARPSKPRKILATGDASLLYLENMEAAELFGADLSRIPRNEQRTRKLSAAA